MFVLDTNIYIDSFNDAAFGTSLRQFHDRRLPRIVLSAVVIHELLVGADTVQREQALRRALVDPFRQRRRIHVPALHTWDKAAEVDRRLRKVGGFDGSLTQRGFFADILIAVSAREIGATVITRNLADFGRIARVLDLRFAAPWPE